MLGYKMAALNIRLQHLKNVNFDYIYILKQKYSTGIKKAVCDCTKVLIHQYSEQNLIVIQKSCCVNLLEQKYLLSKYAQHKFRGRNLHLAKKTLTFIPTFPNATPICADMLSTSVIHLCKKLNQLQKESEIYFSNIDLELYPSMPNRRTKHAVSFKIQGTCVVY